MKQSALVIDRSLSPFHQKLLQCNFARGTKELLRALDHCIPVENMGEFDDVRIMQSMTVPEIRKLLSCNDRVEATVFDLVNACADDPWLGYTNPVIALGTELICENGFRHYMYVFRSGNDRCIGFLRANMKFNPDFHFFICFFDQPASSEVPS